MGRWFAFPMWVALATSMMGGYAQANSAAADAKPQDAPRRIYVQVYPSEALIEPKRLSLESHIAAGAQAEIDAEIVHAVRDAVDAQALEEALARSGPGVVEAERRLRELDLEGALDALYWAAEEYTVYLPELVRRDGTAHRLVQVHLLQAVAYYLSGDEEAAAKSLRQALVLDPALTYDPKHVPPQLEDFVQQEMRSAHRAGQGALAIRAGPAAPVLYVNGVERGTAPLQIDDLPAGTNLIHARLPGAKPLVTTVEIEGGRRRSVVLDLEPLPSDPEGVMAGPFAGTWADVGKERASSALHRAARALDADGLLLILPRRTARGIALAAYIYDMRSGSLAGRFEASLEGEAARAAHGLGREAMLGARWRPLIEPALVAERQPLWKHKYFWPAVGTATGVVLVSAVLMSSSGLSNGQRLVLFSVMRY